MEIPDSLFKWRAKWAEGLVLLQVRFTCRCVRDPLAWQFGTELFHRTPGWALVHRRCCPRLVAVFLHVFETFEVYATVSVDDSALLWEERRVQSFYGAVYWTPRAEEAPRFPLFADIVVVVFWNLSLIHI